MRLFIAALVAIRAPRLVSCLAVAERAADGASCDAHPHATCAQQASSSKYVLENFDYHASYIFTTPAHQNSHGYVSFNLWNTAAPGYTATCSATSDQLTDFFYGTLWYACTLPMTAPAGAAVSFRFNRPTGELDVNGTIVCAERGAAANAFHVEGTTMLNLSCTDSTTTNPDWTDGSGALYSDREVKCLPDTCAF